MAFGTNAIKRTTILSLMDKAIAAQEVGTVAEAFDVAVEVLADFDELGIMVDDEEAGSGNSRSGGRKRSSGGRGSRSKSSRRGSSRGGGNDEWRDDPATDKQIDKAIEVGALEDGYSESELEQMTKGEISDLIDALK